MVSPKTFATEQKYKGSMQMDFFSGFKETFNFNLCAEKIFLSRLTGDKMSTSELIHSLSGVALTENNQTVISIQTVL